MVINENGLITEDQNTQEYIENLSITQETSDFDLNSNEDSNIQNSMNTSGNDIFTNSTDCAPEQEEKETVETNCLALTVRKDYNLSIFKNSIATTFRVSWKIAVSTFLLNLLKLFF